MKFYTHIGCLILLMAVVWQEVTAVSEASEIDIEEIQKECQAEHDISDAEFEQFNNSTIANDDATDNTKLKCFTYCMLKRMDYLDENDKIDVEKINRNGEVNGFDIDKINDCKAMHDLTDDPCEYSFNMIICTTFN